MFIDPLGHRSDSGGLASSAVVAGHGASEDDDAAAIDLGALSGRDLKDRVAWLVAERARIDAAYLAAVGELVSRNGAQGAAHVLREETRMNSPQARSEARLAESIVEHEMSDTLDALRSGEIQLSHARVIAREAPKNHRRSEAEFLELCRGVPL